MPENTADYPAQGQMTPDFWDTVLKTYIDNGDSLSIPAETVTRIVKLTRSEYDAIDPKIETTLYVVVPDPHGLPTDGFWQNGAEAATFGAGTLWTGDGEDSTGVEHLSWDTLDYSVHVATLLPWPDDADPITSLYMWIRCSMTGGLDLDPDEVLRSFIFLTSDAEDTTGDFYLGQFTNHGWNSVATLPDVPLDGTITTTYLPFVLRPGVTMAEVLDFFEADSIYIQVNTFDNNGSADAGTGRIYELGVVVNGTIPT